MSPQKTASTGTAGAGGAVTPGRITIAAVVVLLLVLVFENTREVRIRLLVPEVTMPLYVALLVTALLGAACGYAAARRRK